MTKINLKVVKYTKDKEFYFRYNPNKHKGKKNFNNKKEKDNPFGILKNINFK